MNKKLAGIYDQVLEFVSSECMSNNVREVLYKRYNDFEDKLKKYKNELTSEECSIVFAGTFCIFSYVHKMKSSF